MVERHGWRPYGGGPDVVEEEATGIRPHEDMHIQVHSNLTHDRGDYRNHQSNHKKMYQRSVRAMHHACYYAGS